MVSQKVKITNPAGLHVHPAGHLCNTAMKYQCKVTFKGRNGNVSNAKSLLSVLGAAVRCGEELEFICEGEDEVEALADIITVVEHGLQD